MFTPPNTWTPERVETLTLLWDEGVTTAEIGRRIGLSKNAVIGKVHRLGLVPRVIIAKPPSPNAVPDYFERVTARSCVWPHGHPGTPDFHFCGADKRPGSPYCGNHHAVAYIPPKRPGQEFAEAAD